MEQVDELKKLAKCQKCHESYSEGSSKYIFDKCRHHTCDSCLEFTFNCRFNCPICQIKSYATGTIFHHDTLLKMYESSLAKSAEVEKDLKNRILTLEQERDASKESQKYYYYKCAECEKTVSEQDMQLCETCHELDFENYEEFKKNAICACCAIKKHMRKGHEIVDFYPYLSAYNYSQHLPKIETESEELKGTRLFFENSLSAYNKASENVSKEYDLLTDMARRSKSTKSQLDVIDKMEKFIEKSKLIHLRAGEYLDSQSKLLMESAEEINEWCKARNIETVDETEIVKLDSIAGFVKNGDNGIRRIGRKRAHPWNWLEI